MHPTKRIQLEEGFSTVDSPTLMRPRDKVKRLQRMAEFGSFEHNDRVRSLEEVFGDNLTTVFKINWKERPDGTPLKPTFMEYSELKYKAPYKIIEWFESKNNLTQVPQQLDQTMDQTMDQNQNQIQTQTQAQNQIDINIQNQTHQNPNQQPDQTQNHERNQEQDQFQEIPIQRELNQVPNYNNLDQHEQGQENRQPEPFNALQSPFLEEPFQPIREIPSTPPQEDYLSQFPPQQLQTPSYIEALPQTYVERIDTPPIHSPPVIIEAAQPDTHHEHESPELIMKPAETPQVPMIIVESEPVIIQPPPQQETFYSIQIDDDNQPVQVTPPPPNKVRRRKAVIPLQQMKPLYIDIINLSDEEINVVTPHQRKLPSPKLEEKTHLQELLSISEAMIKDSNNNSGSKGFISRLFGR